MIRSMTGFGRSENTVNGYDVTVEVKAVNHRYADYNIKLPRVYSFLEEDIKKHFQQYISRGKVDIFLTIFKYFLFRTIYERSRRLQGITTYSP